MKLLGWGLTDVGQKREHNEDALVVRPDLNLFAVADGMGGHQGGDRASRLAVEILQREVQRGTAAGREDPRAERGAIEPAQELRSAARSAGRVIFNLAQQDPRLNGMGTTLTTLLVHEGRAHLAHVGDSRAYLFRDERLEQLTEDHSWIEEQVRSGFMTSDEARESSLRHIITRSVGFEPDVEVDQLSIPVLLGDCFLLCSDGLSNYLSADELREILSEGFYSDVPQRLVEVANSRGGDDNITVVLVYVANDTRQQAGPVAELDLDDEHDLDDEFDPYAPTLAPEGPELTGAKDED